MYKLYYSISGNMPWSPFNTGAWFWSSSKGFAMSQSFATFAIAEQTVLEWMRNGKNHYPVAIFWGAKEAAIFDTKEWPYLLEPPDYCGVFRADGSEQMDAVVVV